MNEAHTETSYQYPPSVTETSNSTTHLKEKKISQVYKGQIFLFRTYQFAFVPLVYKATLPLRFCNTTVSWNDFERRILKRQLLKCWCLK